jgi:hypothetical protein
MTRALARHRETPPITAMAMRGRFVSPARERTEVI